MRFLNLFTLRQKIGWSFGALIALIVLNAVVVGFATYSISRQLEQQKSVEIVISEVDRAQLLISRYVNSPKAEISTQVFQSLLSVKQKIHQVNREIDQQPLLTMPSLLADYRLEFQKYMIEVDRRAAFQAIAATLGTNMFKKLRVAQEDQRIRVYRGDLDALTFQSMALQWGGLAASAISEAELKSQTNQISETLVQLRLDSQAESRNPDVGLVLFRIQRDASDFLTAVDLFSAFQRATGATEKQLLVLSDKIQNDCRAVSVTVAEHIRMRILLTAGVAILMFLLSVLSAMVLTRYLRHEILRPIQTLIGVTREIAGGKLQERAPVTVDDEIGELSYSFNQMTQSLLESRSELLAEHSQLEQARAELEQRVKQRTTQLLAVNYSLTEQMTALAQAKAEIEMGNQSIVARELLLRQIMDTAPVSVFLVDMDGYVTQANTCMVEMFGYPMDVLRGKAYFSFFDAGELEESRQKLSELINEDIPMLDVDLKFVRSNGESFWAHSTGKLFRDAAGKKMGLVGVIADITALKEQEQQLRNLAHFDALTGLPNRIFLAERLHLAMLQRQRRNDCVAVAYLDLDGFKAVNDRYGHDAGDELLMTLSQRMKESLRVGDTLARIGGDEFVAVLVDLPDVEGCEPLLERLLSAASSSVDIHSREGIVQVKVSASIGVTLYPRDDSDPDMLLRHADQAMYVAKQSGKNRYHVFDVAYDAAIKVQVEGQEHVSQALGNNEFVLFYQPKVDMTTGRVTGMEALIRWSHPERGLLSPAAFLPAIQGHAISIDMGEWVIVRALAQMSAWRSQGLSLPVSVNIGADQLQQDRFEVRLRGWLSQYPDVPPQWLQLEVLETSALEDLVKVSDAMNACHKMGVTFALDDFGTGYSSLTYLKRLPAKTLKIDQSFVRDMLEDANDLAIVSGVIGLARAFGREVIAEGVETKAHGDRLKAIGCSLAQGYGIARPMPAEDVAQWVQQWHDHAAWTV